jgi:hypothetical protein
MSPISAAAAAVGASWRAAASSSSSPSRNGLPPVTSLQASMNRSWGSPESCALTNERIASDVSGESAERLEASQYGPCCYA